MAVLFGSRARGADRPTSDHDIFLVIDNLDSRPLKRQKNIRRTIWDFPLRVNTIAKTPLEVSSNLTPFLLEVFVDGICLYGNEYFDDLRAKAIKAIQEAGLRRKTVGKEWHWEFDTIPQKEWELTWEGFRELP